MNAELVMLDVLTVALGNKGGLDERAISQLLSTETIVRYSAKYPPSTHHYRALNYCPLKLFSVKYPPVSLQQDCTALYSSTIVCVNQHKPLQLGTEIRKTDCQMNDFFELTKSFGSSASWRGVCE